MALTLDAKFSEAMERAGCEPLIYARVELSTDTTTWAGSVSSGDTTVTLTTGTTAALLVGMEIRHANIPVNTTIESITNATTFELSIEATGSISSAALTVVRILPLITGPSDHLDGEHIIESVTPITKKLDPYSRKFTPGEVNLKCVDDGTIRYHNGTYPLKGRTVRMWLGSRELALGESAAYFVGVINEVTPVEGAIELQCRNFFELLDSATFEGSYYCKHPLVVIKQLLEHGGISTDYIDANSFDPSHSDHAAIRHYTITSVDMSFGPFQHLDEYVNGYNPQVTVAPEVHGNRWQGSVIDGAGYPGPDKPVSIIKLINHLVFYLSGMMWIGEDGKVYFKRFDKTESTVAHLTTDDYGTFKQLSAHEHIANDFMLPIGSHGEDKFMRVRDTAAITACGTWPKRESPSITTSKMKGEHSTAWLTSTDASVSAGDSLSGFISLLGLQVTGTTGTQGTTVTGSTFNYPSGSAAGYVTSDYPIILEWRGEIIKGTTIAMQSTPIAYAPNVADDGTIQVTDYSGVDYIEMTPTLGRVKVTAGVRGFASTTPVQVTPAQWWAELLTGHPSDVNDWTMIYNWVTSYAIPRFSYGLATMEITTPLAQFAIEVGDLISIDNDVFLWRDNDGLSSSSKLEVIGKEVDPFADNPQIKFTLAMANPASAPTNTITYTTPTTNVTTNGTSGGLIASGEVSYVGGSAAQDGLTMSDGGSLNTLISKGASVRGTNLIRWDRGVALTSMTANKENHVTVDPMTGVFYAYPETTNNPDPAMARGDLHLGVATAGASSMSSFTDERALGIISGEQLDRRSIEAGRNFVTDGTFQSWPLGGSAPVRGWYLNTGTWGTDAKQSRSVKHSGRCSLHMPATSTAAECYSDYFAVMPGELYEVSAWFRANNTSTVVKANLRWYDAGKAYLSRDQPCGGALTSANVWERMSGLAEAPAYAAFCRVNLNRQASAGDAYFDDVNVGLGTVAFSARLTADASSLSSGDAVPFAGEDYDRGSNFDTSNYWFKAPNQGFYKFQASMVIGASSNAKNVTLLLKKTSSSTTTTLKALNLEDIDTGDAGHRLAVIQAGAELKAEDVVFVTLEFSSGQPVIEGTATTATSYIGELVR